MPNEKDRTVAVDASTLPPHMKYRPSPEIVRAHEQFQALFRQQVGQLQSMGHVRAGEAILSTVMPLFEGVNALFALLQADLASYTELAVALAAVGEQPGQVIAGLLPDDSEMLAEMLDAIGEKIESVQKGLKKDSAPVETLGEALDMLADVQQAIIDAALDEDLAPEEGEEDDAPAPPAAVEGYEESSPLQIG